MRNGLQSRQVGLEEKMKNEQRRVPDATIKKFADMTDKNQHTEVRLQIAKIIGDNNLIKKYEKLKKDQDKAGSLTGTLQRTRQTLDKELLSKAFDELGNARQVMGALQVDKQNKYDIMQI